MVDALGLEKVVFEAAAQDVCSWYVRNDRPKER
jgi:hypothetical protein